MSQPLSDVKPAYRSAAGEPLTHEPKRTIGRDEASEQTKALWESLQNIARNEEAWFIIEAALDNAHDEGYRTGIGGCQKCEELEGPDFEYPVSLGTVKARDLEYL
jgi:hypothetical protein